MNEIENYNKALQELYDHVGFKEDVHFGQRVVYPIDDCTSQYWYIVMDENEIPSEVHYADTLEELENEEGRYYIDEIYTQRFYKKWVYPGEKFTMIFCDPGVDGMKWFRVFDNTKKITLSK